MHDDVGIAGSCTKRMCSHFIAATATTLAHFAVTQFVAVGLAY